MARKQMIRDDEAAGALKAQKKGTTEHQDERDWAGEEKEEERDRRIKEEGVERGKGARAVVLVSFVREETERDVLGVVCTRAPCG